MTTYSRREAINRAVLDAITESGATGLHIRDPLSHPRKYLIAKDDGQTSLWVYAWSLTPGGRRALPNEYRIQMTSVESPLPTNPAGVTILIGYEPNLDVFAGYDLTRHSTFTTGSPSVQMNVNTLRQALQRGLAFETKSNGEVVIGVRSDHFLFYCERAAELHSLGDNVQSLESVVSRSAELNVVPDEETDSMPRERRRVVRETARWSRLASFRRQVLNAYENRCAVTRWQMRLVDAAHILPVAAGVESIDHIRNGIALSPTYHRAFDRGVIYLDEDMIMRLNRNASDELLRIGLGAGFHELESSLGRVHLPLDPNQRPDPDFIRLANRHRGI